MGYSCLSDSMTKSRVMGGGAEGRVAYLCLSDSLTNFAAWTLRLKTSSSSSSAASSSAVPAEARNQDLGFGVQGLWFGAF